MYWIIMSNLLFLALSRNQFVFVLCFLFLFFFLFKSSLKKSQKFQLKWKSNNYLEYKNWRKCKIKFKIQTIENSCNILKLDQKKIYYEWKFSTKRSKPQKQMPHFLLIYTICMICANWRVQLNKHHSKAFFSIFSYRKT